MSGIDSTPSAPDLSSLDPSRTVPLMGPGGRVAPAVDSSSVLLLRDANADKGGLDVLLLRRHTASPAFAGGFVFPGGKVADDDRHLAEELWEAGDFPARRAEMGAGTDADALGFLVAAVRETFEEAGVLLARRRDGTPVGPLELHSSSFREARRRLNARDRPWSWASWLHDEALVLTLDSLVLWSWWVTPAHVPHRFDTRFFAAALPRGQVASQDAVEMTAMAWINPDVATRDGIVEGTPLYRPTLLSLEPLIGCPSAAEALDLARRGDLDRRRIQPRVSWHGDELRVDLAIGEPPQTEIPGR